MSPTERVIKIVLAIANTFILGGFVTLMTIIMMMSDGFGGPKYLSLGSVWIIFSLLIIWIMFVWSWALKKPGETLVEKLDQSSDVTGYDA